MSREQLEAHFIARAREMAASGEYGSITEIEQALWEEGCSRPSMLLEVGWIRDELYERLAEALRRRQS